MWWHEAVATAVFAARLAQLRQASVATSFLASLLHRSGEALALQILARVEREHRTKLDSSSRRDWCNGHGRLFAIELLQPDLCVPGALDHAAGEIGLHEGLIAQLRLEGGQVRELIRAMG